MPFRFLRRAVSDAPWKAEPPMTKPLEIHYSQQSTDFVKGRAYGNPRFFSTPRADAVRVHIYGDWPNIEAAYLAIGVPVEKVGSTPVAKPASVAPIKTATPVDAAAVVIPAGWRELPWSKPNADGLTLRGLAASVSPVPVTNGDAARAAIGNEIISRAKAAGWVDGEPTVEEAEGWLSDLAEHKRREEPQGALNGLSIREAHDKLTKAGVEWNAGATPEDLAELLAILEV